jgi:hypothetical protein
MEFPAIKNTVQVNNKRGISKVAPHRGMGHHPQAR